VTPRARIIIIVLAVLGLVVAFVAANDSGDDGQPTPAATTAAAQQPAATTTAPQDGAGETATTTTPAAPAEPAPPLVRVTGGQPQGGVKKLRFRSGERVRFRVRTDTPDEIHIHGYDITKALPAGRTVTVSFPGRLEGRFDVELHGAGTQIASLEVRP
jgi:hypothetical protein